MSRELDRSRLFSCTKEKLIFCVAFTFFRGEAAAIAASEQEEGERHGCKLIRMSPKMHSTNYYSLGLGSTAPVK